MSNLVSHSEINLVEVVGNQPMTTSITVADTFEKRHSDVLRSIQTLECSPEFSQRNFALTEYSDAQGRRLYVYY